MNFYFISFTKKKEIMKQKLKYIHKYNLLIYEQTSLIR
jgi:hypothetical protein